MKLSQVKDELQKLEVVNFVLENGNMLAEHFHVTEIGIVTRHFIDCGGTVRTEKTASFQLWEANDFDHRLKPNKMMNIIALAERILELEDLEVEVEYQGDTIGRYNLDFNGTNFVLLTKNTSCLASDKCGIPTGRLKTNSKAVTTACTPGGGCC